LAVIAAEGTDLYCYSEPPLTSGKLCFIINFIGRREYRGGGRSPQINGCTDSYDSAISFCDFLWF